VASAPPAQTNSLHPLGLAAAAVAVAGWGTSGVIVKAVDLDPVAISFYRFAIYTTAVFAVLTIRNGLPPLSVLKYSMPGGLFLGMDVVLFFTAVKTTSVVNATTIGAMQPVIIVGIASRFFGERIRLREVAAAGAAIVGVVVVITRSSGTPQWSGAGDLAAVGALFAWTGYLVMSKRSAGRMTSMEYTLGTGFWTAVVSLPVGFVTGQDMSIPGPADWVILAVLVVMGGVLGHSMMNWALTRIPLWLGSVVTLMIPVVSSLAAWAFLGEALDTVQVVAIVGVVAALATVVTGQQRPAPVPDPTAPLTSEADMDVPGSPAREDREPA
jgi:drug/metabolite transporter (DMT)-like permease